MLEYEYKDISLSLDLNQKLLDGECIIIRNSPLISHFRNELIQFASTDQQMQKRLYTFYENGIVPRDEDLKLLTDAIKKARTNAYLSTLFSEFISLFNFGQDIYLDGGISRLVLPRKKYEELQASSLFNKSDFTRKRAGSDVETFMSGVTNIHRDFNRPHSMYMFNFWIPMHAMESDEVLQIFPQEYCEQITDLENNEENIKKLSPAEKYDLNFGDFVVFHSEQLHVSPKRNILTTLRHSFDLRVATMCQNDNVHYRENFLNLNNFLTYIENSSNRVLNYDNVSLEFLNAKQLFGKFKEGFLNAVTLFNLYKKLPFSEDRYIVLAKDVLYSDTALTTEILEYVLNNTQNYFWIYKTARIFSYINDQNNADRCLDTALKKSLTDNFSFKNIIEYENVSKELSPRYLKKKIERIQAREYKNLLIISRNYTANLEKILDELPNCEIICANNLESFLTYYIQHLVTHIYRSNFSMVKDSELWLSYRDNFYENIYVLPEENNVSNADYLCVALYLKSDKVYTIDRNNQYVDITQSRKEIVQNFNDTKLNFEVLSQEEQNLYVNSLKKSLTERLKNER